MWKYTTLLGVVNTHARTQPIGLLIDSKLALAYNSLQDEHT